MYPEDGSCGASADLYPYLKPSAVWGSVKSINRWHPTQEGPLKFEPVHRNPRAPEPTATVSNAVLGIVSLRSQQSPREPLNLVSGTDTDLLYGEHGHARAKGQGAAIAEA